MRVPVSFIYGSDELTDGNPAFDNLVSELKGLSWRRPPSVTVVPEANHFYAGRMPRLLDEITRALDQSV